MASIAMIVVWKFMGYYGLIFLAGLQSIPKSLYESAEIDGASNWTQFWRITIPLLNPSFIIILVFAVMLMQIYHQTFTALHAGYGSSFAILVAIISFTFVFVIRKMVERDISYG